MNRTLLAAAAAATLLSGCDSKPRLETRTFALQNIEAHEAASLVDPYIYGTRDKAPGTLSQSSRAITVRETPDNLDQIARVLAEFDVPRADVRLRFQLIEADGFTDADPRIATVEAELRKVFQFRGYRLAGEAFVTATDGSQVEQGLGSAHSVQTRIYRQGANSLRLEEVQLWAHASGVRLTTTVNIRPGQTLILGSASREEDETTLLLTVQAEEVEG